MEPLFFKAENPRQRKRSRHYSSASMEPLFFKAENSVNSFWCVPLFGASMEPLFFKAENKLFVFLVRPVRGSFNGAAFFQSGKCSGLSASKIRHLGLQWSRFFSKRKIPHSQAPCFQRPAGCLASGREFIPTKPRSHQPCFCKFKPHKPFSPASSSRPTQHHLATRTDPTQHHCMTMDATQQR